MITLEQAAETAQQAFLSQATSRESNCRDWQYRVAVAVEAGEIWLAVMEATGDLNDHGVLQDHVQYLRGLLEKNCIGESWCRCDEHLLVQQPNQS